MHETILLAAMLFLPGGESSTRWFGASADPQRLQTFRVEGVSVPVCGTVYGPKLEQGGMPLGGLGTGYLCLDPDGRLGKCSIFNRLPYPLQLGQPCFYLKLGDRRLTLATPKDGQGDAKTVHYFGHFPVADVRFELAEPIQVELRAYSPFLPGDAGESNTPAAVFLVRITNLSSQPQKGVLIFSPGGFPQGTAEAFSPGQNWTGIQVRHKPVDRLPDWAPCTYALAVENGSADADSSGVQVGADFQLQPAEAAVVRFILAWHQPYLRERSGRVEKHKYAERFADAKAVAEAAVRSHEQWLRRVLAWQEVIYGAQLPDWLKEELVNVLSTLTKNSVWLARTRPDDWWDQEGLFLVNESFATCPVMETMPCRFFGHWPTLFFFPELERSSLKAIRFFQLRGGQPPFCLGLEFAIRDPRYHCQHTAGAGEYAQMIYRYYLRTGDEAFLKDFWPSARDSLNFMLWLDRDGDGLVEDHSHAAEGEYFPANNPMDTWPFYGASSYTAGKGLASLICGVKMAELMGDQAQAAQWRKVLQRGQQSYEEKLWTGEFYRTYNDPATGRRNDSCLAAQLHSVWCTRVLGLEDPLPKDRIHKALDSIARLNMPASRFGMVNAVFADGKPCIEGGPDPDGGRIWSRDIFIQCNATAAMVFMYHGRRQEGEKAAQTMLDTLFRGPHPMPWSQPCGIHSLTGATTHGHDYYDHMVVWTYPLALAGQDIRAACAAGGLIDRILRAAAQRKSSPDPQRPTP
ncbi:MAG: GH116 family glycosyl hydrolase [Thermoguttaceae bacterium]|nr:GH116 family glycosyl hydrolase [Thermoguttaceae bacterium]MDW8039546.1 GH116 family glycosyl hydrolase [Thermoguttaceae bacterium]